MRLALGTALVALGACGYAFSQRYVAKGGSERIHVAAFENRSTEPGMGAAFTAALRAELARRGADAGEGAAARIEGEVRVPEPRPATEGAGTWRIALVVRARLVREGGVLDERELRREIDYLGEGDPLGTEGRRALALRRLAEETAREVLRTFEEPR